MLALDHKTILSNICATGSTPSLLTTVGLPGLKAEKSANRQRKSDSESHTGTRAKRVGVRTQEPDTSLCWESSPPSARDSATPALATSKLSPTNFRSGFPTRFSGRALRGAQGDPQRQRPRRPSGRPRVPIHCAPRPGQRFREPRPPRPSADLGKAPPGSGGAGSPGRPGAGQRAGWRRTPARTTAHPPRALPAGQCRSTAERSGAPRSVAEWTPDRLRHQAPFAPQIKRES